MKHIEDDENEPLTEEEIEAIYNQFPSFDEMTPMDACLFAGFLIDIEMPVPTDLIAKAHSAGLYFAH